MSKYYFTFGFGQPHANCYHVIEAESWNEAREIMFRKFGINWSMQYDSAEAAGVQKYRLMEIK